MRNIRLVLAYDGTDFHGWQRQPNLPTIQECLESAVEKVIRERVVVWGSGRTDAGVHASHQVANFKIQCGIPCENLLKALNNLLPLAVRVKEASEVDQAFHARYHVRAKTYRYRILQAPSCSPFISRFVWHYDPHPLDRKRMAEAARLIEGEHDFTSFAASEGSADVSTDTNPLGLPTLPGEPSDADLGRSASAKHQKGGDSTSMVRTIFSSRVLWRARPRILIYEVCGNGFLHHMVRNMVGTLVEVGKGRLEPADIAKILKARDRRLAGRTAPARGLCLVKVEY